MWILLIILKRLLTELQDEPDAADASIQENKSDKGDNRVLISPLAKKMAKESNLDISLISGTGPSGRIIKRYFESYRFA